MTDPVADPDRPETVRDETDCLDTTDIDTTDVAFEDMLNRSSLGTPGAARLRRRADAADAARVQRAANRPPNRDLDEPTPR